MPPISVTIRELKSHLSTHLKRVQTGDTIIVTHRGEPIARILPVAPSPEARVRELTQSGLVAWSGRKLKPHKPRARTRGTKTVAGLLLQDRR